MENCKSVESKGMVWIVTESGGIRSPAHSSEYVRERNGKQQKFTSHFTEKTLSPYVAKNGYLEVSMLRNGKRVKHLVHRLIGLAFVDGYEFGLTINHIDGNKTNNDPNNLEWVSLSKNTIHQWETGLVDLRGEKNPSSILTSKRVVYIRKLIRMGVSLHTIAIVSGMSNSTISLIASGKRWGSVKTLAGQR